MTSLLRRLDLHAPDFGITAKYLRTLSSRLKASKSDQAVQEAIPDFLMLLVSCLRGGASHLESLAWIKERCTGDLRTQIEEMISHLRVGETVATSLLNFERSTPNADLRELAVKLAIADQIGAPVATTIEAMVDSSAAACDARLFALGAKKENQILYPLVFMVLPVTVLFAVYPSLQYLNFSYT